LICILRFFSSALLDDALGAALDAEGPAEALVPALVLARFADGGAASSSSSWPGTSAWTEEREG
jgi:hypothetical protein